MSFDESPRTKKIPDRFQLASLIRFFRAGKIAVAFIPLFRYPWEAE
jgi:hypothetical protein